MKIRIFGRVLPFPHLFVDLIIIVIALYVSLWVRLGNNLEDHLSALTAFLPIFVALRLTSLFAFGVYQGMWRYTSLRDANLIARGVGFSSLLFVAVTYLLPDLGYIPRSFYFIDFVISCGLLIGARGFRRSLFESGQKLPKSEVHVRRALIVGAGNNGRSLLQTLTNNPATGMKVIGFIDDDLTKQDRSILGVSVLGTRADLGILLEKTEANEVILAVTNPPGELLRDVVSVCRRFNIHPQIISQFGLRSHRNHREEIYREVNLNDLLNRQAADIDYSSVQKLVQNKTVLITGAGGSIGSEVARQISRLGPTRLLLLDHSEYNLYEIDKELRLETTNFEKVVPLMVDIKDRASLEQVFSEYKPQWIFHAAAYKHVHLVEANPLPSILNNIEGTKHLLELSRGPQVEGFVQISTDKAVNPVGVMGSTKRVCELLVSAEGRKNNKTFCSVRFGNVLGSSGSLIPLLQKQIREGGPVTITHADMTRYFMLIPEAVSLVLMAATISKPGDVSVLKMGEPVKILDIAKSLIAFMGKTEEQVPIIFTGLRPGEKMYEELYISGKELETIHPDILTLPDGDLGLEAFNQNSFTTDIDSMLALAKAGDRSAVNILGRLAHTQPQPDISTKSSSTALN